jgi:hypothetical protein
MRHDLDMNVIAGIGKTGDECADDGCKDEELRNGSVGEARGYHCL